MKILKFILPLILAFILLVSASPTVQAQDNLAYPVLPEKGVQYYDTIFPTGLRYSDGWYGTFTYAPKASQILLFDDNKGICIFSLPEGIEPRGEQGGTKLEAISKDEADKIIQSYPLKELVEPYDIEITDIMQNDDYFLGAQAGEKLTQKFNSPQNLDEKIQKIREDTGLEVAPPILTQKQIDAKEAFKQAHLDIGQVDLSKFDPNRFWVLGGGLTANWSDNTGHWSATTGGAPNASLPTSADDVYFDANSFLVSTGTVTVDATANCLNMDWTGAANSPTLHWNSNIFLYVYGSLTFISTLSITRASGSVLSLEGSGSKNITSGNISVGQNTYFGYLGSGGTWTVQDSWNIFSGTRDLILYSGTLDTNGKTLSCGSFQSASGQTVTLGASIINCVVFVSNGTINANTSSIRLSGTSTFNGQSKTFNEVQLNGATCTISGSNTFATLSLPSGTTQTITFTDGTTQTAETFNLSGSSGHVHTLQGSSTGGWNITKSGGGLVTMDYVSVSRSTASPDNTFYDFTHPTDGGNNVHWYFTAPPATYAISNTPATKDFGIITQSATYYAKGSAPSNPVTDGNCTFTITNGDPYNAVKINANATNFTGGVGATLHASPPGTDQVTMTLYYSGQNPASGLVMTTSDQVFIASLAANVTKMWDFNLQLGGTTDAVQKSSAITFTGVAP
jgi:hypothetical protein